MVYSEFADKLKKLLSGEASRLRLSVFDTIDSTSTYLKSNFEPYMCVYAAEQTGGRGRRGRSFYCYRGGAYFSFSLPEVLPTDRAYLITTLCAVAVCDAVEKNTDKKPGIKWVNDIFLGDKKVCGILTEHTNGGYVIGIGINTGECDTLPDIAASLGVGEDVSVSICADVLNTVCDSIAKENYRCDEYIARSMLLGRQVTVNGADKAVCLGIDSETLGLHVRYEDGRECVLCCGEVSLCLN